MLIFLDLMEELARDKGLLFFNFFLFSQIFKNLLL